MTGYTVHTGSNQKFTTGWDHIFQGIGSTRKSGSSSRAGKKKVATPPKTAKKKAATKKTVTKKTKRSKSGNL